MTRPPSTTSRSAWASVQSVRLARFSAGFRNAVARRPAAAAALVDLEIADAFIVAAVEIVGRRNAVLGGGLAEQVEHLPAEPQLLDPPFAALAVHVVGRRRRDARS